MTLPSLFLSHGAPTLPLIDTPATAQPMVSAVESREAVERQIVDLDRKVMRLARSDAQVRRFMTAPGVGAITALCFRATIDDPTRFKKSRSVGAYVGLTTRRYASGEIDWTGRISKCSDAMLRSYLYEAANVLLTRVAKWSVLKAWGIRLAKRSGLRKGGAKRAALPRECGRMGFSGTTAAAWARAYGCDRRVAACQQLIGPRAKFIVIRELDGMGGARRAARAKLAE